MKIREYYFLHNQTILRQLIEMCGALETDEYMLPEDKQQIWDAIHLQLNVYQKALERAEVSFNE